MSNFRPLCNKILGSYTPWPHSCCLWFYILLCTRPNEIAQFTLWTFFFTRFAENANSRIRERMWWATQGKNENNPLAILKHENVSCYSNFSWKSGPLIYSIIFLGPHDHWAVSSGSKFMVVYCLNIFCAVRPLKWLNSHFELSSSHVLIIRNSWKSKVQIQKGS